MNLKDLRGFIKNENKLKLSFFKKLFDICYGMFDVTVSWAENWEKEYMKYNGLEYSHNSMTTHNGRDKGCLCIIVTKAKTEIVRDIQVLCEKMQGVYISLEMKRNENEKRRRRKPGCFYKDFIKYSANKVEGTKKRINQSSQRQEEHVSDDGLID